MTINIGTAQNIDEAVKLINKARLANKDRWVFLRGKVGITCFDMKFYNTWIQVFRAHYNPVNYASEMDLNVTGFKEHIKKYLTEMVEIDNEPG